MHIPGFLIRPARPGEVAALPAIESAASQRFRALPEGQGLPAGLEGHANAVATLAAAQQAGRLWVAVSTSVSESTGAAADERPVGFALAVMLDGQPHLEELDVLPGWGRRGLGTALVNAVVEWARGKGFAMLTLRTFRDVAWNGPFYERLSFVGLDAGAGAGSAALRELPEVERRLGFDLARRVTMIRRL